MAPVTLSHYQVRPLLEKRPPAGGSVHLSLDLGLTETALIGESRGLRLPDERLLTWAAMEEIVTGENACFGLDSDGRPVRLAFFSEETGRSYALFPTVTAPTMLVSGITMHRIVNSDPWRDTAAKIAALGRPPVDRLLDTCMGLGYSAIQAAASVAAVVTCELDPIVESVCRANPWSQPLFELAVIDRRLGHVWDLVEILPDGSFEDILHDPPRFSMAGELYSGEFYRELYRLLAARGRLFHYIGNPESRSGARVTRGVIRRLREAGFRQVVPRPKAFGVLAVK